MPGFLRYRRLMTRACRARNRFVSFFRYGAIRIVARTAGHHEEEEEEEEEGR